MKQSSKLLVLVALVTLLAAAKAMALPSPTGFATKPLQFTSGGHIVGFTSTDLHVAAGDHALRIEFVGAHGVAPIADGSAAPDGQAAPLTRVTYAGLWGGVALTYDAPAGLLRSTYTVAPGADPATIKLRYNVPVAVEPGGGLRIAFATGAMRETAPIAWQDIAGRRVPVIVAFRMDSEREVGFAVGPYDKARPLTIDPTLMWNTFLGGGASDEGRGIAIDGNGNSYITGSSSDTWGDPELPWVGGADIFVAKLNSSGALVWNTFLGQTGLDEGYGIAVDTSGHVYIAGRSDGTWGVEPLLPWIGNRDAFVAKLDCTDGTLLWNTFLGGAVYDAALGIAVDGGNNVYITGQSDGDWGNPYNAWTEASDIFVAKLDTDGALLWNTFLGGTANDSGYGIAVAGGDVFIAGQSSASWGDPANPWVSGADACVARLDGDNGALLWNTFLGGDQFDTGRGIALDASGNVYATGYSASPWGDPNRPWEGSTGSYNAFAAKFDSTDGTLLWNTFLGGDASDQGYAIVVDAGNGLYVTGQSGGNWGNPVLPWVWIGSSDAFVTKLDSDGALLWNIFLGGTANDYGYGIAVTASYYLRVTGRSDGTWGDPKLPWSADRDAFVARLGNIQADITRPTGSILINNGDASTGTTTATLTLSAVDTGGSGLGWMRFRNETDPTFTAWEPYDITRNWTLSSDLGTKQVYVQFKDLAGNISDRNSLVAGPQPYWDKILLKDTTPPSGSIFINDGAESTATTDVTLSLWAFDFGGSGFGWMRFRNEIDSTFTEWEPYSSLPRSWTLSSGPGTKRVYVQYMDFAGNISDKNSLAAGPQPYWDKIELAP